jgi:hypothetical protein
MTYMVITASYVFYLLLHNLLGIGLRVKKIKPKAATTLFYALRATMFQFRFVHGQSTAADMFQTFHQAGLHTYKT